MSTDRPVTEHLREHLWLRARREAGQPWLPPLDELRRTQWSTPFEEKMRARLIVGAMRYGLNFVGEPGKVAWSRVESMRRRLAAYAADGNVEHLVDVANLAMLEAEEGEHPLKHWAATDDGEHTRRAT